MKGIIISISTLTSIISDALAFMISLILLFIIIFRIIQAKSNRTSNIIDVPLVISINILCILICKILIQTHHITYPLIKTYFRNQSNIDSHFSCYVRSYLLWSSIGILYWNYTLLTFFRFARIIYPQQKHLLRLSSYLYICIPLIVLIVSLLTFPVFFILSGIQIIPNRPYCDIIVKPSYYIAYIGVITFIIPYSMICIFYFYIASFLRRTKTILANRERNRRDYTVIKRIVLNTIILGIVSTPDVILIILYNIDDRFGEFVYSTIWSISSISALLFTIILPFITTQLYHLVKRNEVTPIVGSLE